MVTEMLDSAIREGLILPLKESEDGKNRSYEVSKLVQKDPREFLRIFSGLDEECISEVIKKVQVAKV